MTRSHSRRTFLSSLGAGALAPAVATASLGPAAAVVSAQTTQPSAVGAPLDATAQLLKALSEAPGPSGFEEDVRRIVVNEFGALGAAIDYDGLGSVLATLPGNAASGPRIMVTAHLDEVGLMVQHITPDGFLRAKILGGILEQGLPDQRWTVLTRQGRVTAISGLRTTHVLPQSQRGQVWSLEETFFDVGATSREEVERMGIRPGDGMAPLSDFMVMANGRYAGKAWDDRVGLAVMIAAARRIRAEGIKLPSPIVWVATTQEEIGLRGAQTAVDKAKPDLGISIEAGVSADYPAIGPTQAQERLGGGPGIFLLDSSMIPNRKFRDFFFDVAAPRRRRSRCSRTCSPATAKTAPRSSATTAAVRR